MNNEIKEILDKLQRVANRETASYNALIEMKNTDYRLLLDYITNLQDNNEYLNKCNIELARRNTKAIEYIDKTQMGEGYKKELHNILKGSDK